MNAKSILEGKVISPPNVILFNESTTMLKIQIFTVKKKHKQCEFDFTINYDLGFVSWSVTFLM